MKVVAGEVWETHHAAFEIYDDRLSDPTAVINKYSEYVTIASSRAGIQCAAGIAREKANGKIGVYGSLLGFRGEGVIDITLVGFHGEQVVSKHYNTGKHTWTEDQGYGAANLVTSADLLSRGYVSRAYPTAHVLVTFHLKMS